MNSSVAGRVLGFVAAILLGGSVNGQAAPIPVPRLPPPGIALSNADRLELTAGASELGRRVDALRKRSADWPDVAVFHKAVDWALRFDEFFDAKQVAFARHLLAEGNERAAQLMAGRTPWKSATGLVIRGYLSQIDDSVQPYGLVVPRDYTPAGGVRRRLDVVLSGRNEKRTELAFVAEHEKSPGEIVPEGALLLYPYGRFCNATKFAGETDVFEALEAVRRDYPVDARRIVMRGFSMGGASAWHLAVHHSGVWCAASAGAGFAETALYAKVDGPGKEPRTWWERTLWNWYDATVDAGNLFNCPMVAYSGEIDPQKQSADIMERAMASEGLKLERLIGPKTGHKYEPATKKVLAARLDELAAGGGNEFPREVRLTTYSLKYPRVDWVSVGGLEKHWTRADARARWDSGRVVTAETKNVTAISFILDDVREVTIDGQKLALSNPSSAQGVALRREAGKWMIEAGVVQSMNGEALPKPGTAPAGGAGLRKRPAPHAAGLPGTSLTGPIDDAFTGAFLFVRPTGSPLNPKVGGWVRAEMAHAGRMWRDLFRGEAPVRDDVSVSADDIATHNLILWGDPGSNKLLARVLGRLPIRWDARELGFRGRTYDAADHVPILIFPNPLNPDRYVVLNSGMDFRDEGYGSNALQTPKLPDWAIVDLRTPPGPRWPGKIEDAGFFDEQWRPGAEAP